MDADEEVGIGSPDESGFKSLLGSSSLKYQPLSEEDDVPQEPSNGAQPQSPANGVSLAPLNFEEIVQSWSDSLTFAPAAQLTQDPSNIWSLGDSDSTAALVHRLATNWESEVSVCTASSLASPTPAASSPPPSSRSAEPSSLVDDYLDDNQRNDGLVPESPYTRRSRTIQDALPKPLFDGPKAFPPSLWRVMWQFLGRDYGVAGVLMLLQGVLQIVPAITLPAIINYLQYGAAHTSAFRCIILALVASVAMVGYAVVRNQAVFRAGRLSLHFSSALRGLLFAKILRMKFTDQHSSDQIILEQEPSTTVPEAVLKTTTQASHFVLTATPIIEHYLLHFHQLWTTPLVILISIFTMWLHTGWTALTGFFVFSLVSISSQILAVQAEELDFDHNLLVHQRDSHLEELLDNFKNVKMQSMDEFFERRLKSDQLSIPSPSLLTWSMSFAVSNMSAICGATATLIADALFAGDEILLDEFFLVLVLFVILQSLIKPYYGLLLHALKMKTAMIKARWLLLSEETESFAKTNVTLACARYAVLTKVHKLRDVEVPTTRSASAQSKTARQSSVARSLEFSVASASSSSPHMLIDESSSSQEDGILRRSAQDDMEDDPQDEDYGGFYEPDSDDSNKSTESMLSTIEHVYMISYQAQQTPQPEAGLVRTTSSIRVHIASAAPSTPVKSPSSSSMTKSPSSSSASIPIARSPSYTSSTPSKKFALNSLATPRKPQAYAPTSSSLHIERNAISLQNATFEWDEVGKAANLKNLNFSIRHGALVVVLGLPGSGKSSLLKAILGEMRLVKGLAKVHGRTSYAPQQPWTLRESVLFNIAFSQNLGSYYETYQHILDVTGLTEDLRQWQEGDKKIVTSSAALTRAQLARLSLARCLYRAADTYLVDDIFSLFESDAKAQQTIDTAFSGRSATRIIALSRYLPVIERADMIIYMKNGEISRIGNYRQLVEAEPEFFESLAIQAKAALFLAQQAVYSTPDQALSSTSENAVAQARSRHRHATSSGDNLAELVGIDPAHIAGPHFANNYQKLLTGLRYYFKRLGLSTFYVVMAALCSVLVLDIVRIYGFGSWVEQNNFIFPIANHPKSTDFRLEQLPSIVIFSLLGLALCGLIFSAFWFLSRGALDASNKIWFALMDAVLRWPISVVSDEGGARMASLLGVEVNRFQALLPRQLHDFWNQFFCFIQFVLVSIAASPVSVLTMLPTLFFALRLQLAKLPIGAGLARYSLAESAELATHFEESLQGTVTIRAFEAESRFLTSLFFRQNASNRVRLSSMLLNHYVNLRLALLAAILFMGVSLGTLLLSLLGYSSAVLFGIGVLFTIEFCDILPSLVQHGVRLVALIHSLFNVRSLIDLSPSEGSWVDDERDPRSVWPSQGAISMSNITIKRHPWIEDPSPEDLEDSAAPEASYRLREFSLEIPGKTRVGICGPPKSGKSGIIHAIMRFSELEKPVESVFSSGEQKLEIDGENILRLGLHTLRQSISVISSTMQTMSIREYLREVAEDAMWDALEKVDLKDKVAFSPSKLESVLLPHSTELSVSERLRLSMARALCAKSKIVIFKEPIELRANVKDFQAVKALLYSVFTQHTLIIIVETLDLLSSVDKIVVMESGKKVQEGTWKGLKEEPSLFRKLLALQEHERDYSQQSPAEVL